MGCCAGWSIWSSGKKTKKSQKPAEEERERAHSGGLFKETSRVKVGSRNSVQHQSRHGWKWRRKKKNNNNICLEASTSMHNGHVKTTTSACACWEEAAKLILHESLSLSRYRDIMFHFTTLQLKRSFHSQSGPRSQRCRRGNLSASPAAK